jgi:hypothetical protein
MEIDVGRVVNSEVGHDVPGADVGYPLADLLVGLGDPPARHLLRELFCLGDAELVGESEEPGLLVDHHPGVAVAGQRLDDSDVVGEPQYALRVTGPQRRSGQVEERHTVDTVDADHVLPLRVVDVGDDHVVGRWGLR